MSGDGHTNFFCLDQSSGGLDTGHGPVILLYPGNFTVLNNIYASCISRTGKSPGDGVMSHHRRARLVHPTTYGKAHIRRGIKDWDLLFDLVERQHPVLCPIDMHGIRHLKRNPISCGALDESDHSPLTDHQVVIQVTTQLMVEIERHFMKRNTVFSEEI